MQRQDRRREKSTEAQEASRVHRAEQEEPGVGKGLEEEQLEETGS